MFFLFSYLQERIRLIRSNGKAVNSNLDNYAVSQIRKTFIITTQEVVTVNYPDLWSEGNAFLISISSDWNTIHSYLGIAFLGIGTNYIFPIVDSGNMEIDIYPTYMTLKNTYSSDNRFKVSITKLTA